MPPFQRDAMLLDQSSSSTPTEASKITPLETTQGSEQEPADQESHLPTHANPADGPVNPTSTRCLRQKATVRFSDTPDIKEMTHVNDMSDEDIFNSWLSDEEIRSMRMECLNIVGMLDDGLADMFDTSLSSCDDEDDEDSCLRGIEDHCETNRERRRILQEQLYNEVFDIQEFLDPLHPEAMKLIAEASSRHSVVSCHEAQTIAQSDALTAERLLQEG